MNVIKNIPGPILIFMGALSLSFGGLIVKSFEGATLWQILFWRSVFFSLTVLVFLIITYKKKLFNALYLSGLPGFIGGVVLSFGFCGYVFAMYSTTVANTNFIISLQILFLAIFGYFFLKEKIFFSYFAIYNFGYYRCINNGRKFPNTWRNVWKFSSIFNAHNICGVDYNCKKISIS